jgi:TonB family protein
MFNNLIESSSHAREFKRRGSFLLLTTIAYAVLFVAGGVASIYAYDAHLDDQNSEEVTMLRPVDLPAVTKEPDRQPATTTKHTNNQETFDRRRDLMASTSHPELPPPMVSTTPSGYLPVRDGLPTIKSDFDSNAAYNPGPGPNVGTPNDHGSRVVMDDKEPVPPAPKLPPKKTVYTTSRVLNGWAIYLPKPVYSQMAKQVRASGMVVVQILIDETGKVISAHAVSGHPVLLPEAVKAAYQARFSPTILGEQPVKVSGVINYNFVLQQ